MKRTSVDVASLAAMFVSVLLLLGIVFTTSAPAPAQAGDADVLPIIFVHGFAGSGAQYQSQAMRFASNGYPAGHIRVFDYNSLSAPPDVVRPALDAFIDDVLAELDADQVYVLGHSMGTSVMQGYLNSSPERAARVAKYVNIDGFTADSLPGGVPTLAIWGAGDPAREVVGAENVYFPNQTHTQSVTSPESFAAQYEFFTGVPPATTDIEPEAKVELAGRAVNFPQNSGWEGATLEIWEVDGVTGARTGSAPQASYTLGADGAFGPFAGDGSQHYEIVLKRDGASDHHFYFQQFMRSDYWIRLLSVAPDNIIAQNIEASARHSTVTVIRYKEWWGDDPGGNNDTLEISGTNVISPAISPLAKRAIGIHTFDKGSDGVTNLAEPDEFFFALPFQTGVDIYMPASAPPNGAICFSNAPRGDESTPQVVNVPNWPSSEHRISIEFTDYVREGDPACGVAGVVDGPQPTPAATAVPTSVAQLPDTGIAPESSGGGPVVLTLGLAVAGVLFLGSAAIWRARKRLIS